MIFTSKAIVNLNNIPESVVTEYLVDAINFFLERSEDFFEDGARYFIVENQCFKCYQGEDQVEKCIEVERAEITPKIRRNCVYRNEDYLALIVGGYIIYSENLR